MADLVFSRFEIELDAGDNAIFHGGEVSHLSLQIRNDCHLTQYPCRSPLIPSTFQVITGNLRIQLRRPITIQAVKLQLKGRAAWLNDAAKKSEIEKVGR